MAIRQLHTEHGVGQGLNHSAFDLNHVVLRHTSESNLLKDSRWKSLQGLDNIMVRDLVASLQSESQSGIRPAEHLQVPPVLLLRTVNWSLTAITDGDKPLVHLSEHDVTIALVAPGQGSHNRAGPKTRLVHAGAPPY